MDLLLPAVVAGGGFIIYKIIGAFADGNGNAGNENAGNKNEIKTLMDVDIDQVTYEGKNTQIDEIESMTIEQIVNKLSKTKIPSYKSHKHFIVDHDITTQYVDLKREYKDLCTDIVTKYFLSSDKCLFNFLAMVCSLHNSAIAIYRKKHKLTPTDLFFVYKGGNILRIVSNDFNKQLPSFVSSLLKEKYDKYFTRSDCDFSIYIDPHLDNFDQIYQDMTMLTYLIQVKIRGIIAKSPTDYFDFYKYTDEFKTSILDKYFTDIKNSASIKDPLNPIFNGKVPTGISFVNAVSTLPTDLPFTYKGSSDFFIQFANKLQTKIAFFPVCEPHSLYVYANETLDFYGMPETRSKFNLVRTKAMFNLFFDDNKTLFKIGGELIDVSVDHKYDHKLIDMYSSGKKSVNRNISQYAMTFNDTDIEFNSYSVQYLARDLELILFVDHIPWADRKYVKRLYRLLYLYLIDIFTLYNDNSKRLAIAKSMLSTFSGKIDSNSLSKLRTQIPKEVLYNRMIDYIENNIMPIVNDTNVDDYNQFIVHIADNMKIAIEVCNNLTHYCLSGRNINIEDIYKNDFSSLIGGSPYQPPQII